MAHYPSVMRLWWIGLVVISCTKQNPAAICANGTCTDPQFPYCDVDGIDGDPNTCVAVTCTPGMFATCRGDDAVTCNAAGDSYDVSTCPNGCVVAESGCHQTPDGPHLQPKYLSTICDTLATTAGFDVSSSASLDTSLDANCNGGIVAQTGAADICVLRYGTITIDAGQTLLVTGSRALALVSDGSLAITGALDVGATGGTSGPGGAVTTTTGTAMNEIGGGGAGFKTTGGAGGSQSTDGGASNGGSASSDPSLFSTLIGGPRAGGGGGGATMIVSCRGAVLVGGAIQAGGGGGAGGMPSVGGDGGGAGGYVVLQGMTMTVSGSIFANGGGGGGGAHANGTQGASGQDGRQATDGVAAAGGPAQGNEGHGGAGGFVGGACGIGTHPTDSTLQPGGGGGSMGFFQTYTPTGSAPTLTPAHASPPFQPNGVVPTT